MTTQIEGDRVSVDPATIEMILADERFHHNLDARAAAFRAGTRPEDKKQNEAADVIVTQKQVVETSRSSVIAHLKLAVFLINYINTYFPDL